MRTPCACALVWLVLTLAGTAPAGAYVPQDDPLGRESDLTSPDRSNPFPDTEPQIVPDDEGMGGEEEFAPVDHSNDDEATPVPAARAGLADVVYGTDALPAAVAKTRADLLEAARTGDIEALRPIFEAQRVPPIVDGFEVVDDAVDSLRLQSGDPEGREILAILSEVLESGYVKIGDKSTTAYVWPYFAEVPFNVLTPPQYVELYRLLTAVDVEEMVRMGRYTFFRVGIAPDGRVRFFSAGDIE